MSAHFKKLSLVNAIVLSTVGCLYGAASHAYNGSVVDAAAINKLIADANIGANVNAAANNNGMKIFDANGNPLSAADVKISTLASSPESVTLSIEKAGYETRTVHKASKSAVAANQQNIYQQNKAGLSQDVPVFLCPAGSPDSDGDSICDEAEESFYDTNPYNSDTDGDSISDAAELFGSNGVDLPFFGADPTRKDLFIEADYYPGLAPYPAAINIVRGAFENAPVGNPDGSSGISLHIDVNQQIANADVNNNLSPLWADFDVIKNRYFDSRRSPFFHYVLFANEFESNGSSGSSRSIPGHDFVVTLGTFTVRGGTLLQQAGTLMHEFGHNLGLLHGGDENANFKPNYLSVMSYNYQFPGLTLDGFSGLMDFSRLRIASVNEARLNEFTAFSPLSGTTEAQLSRYGVRKCNRLMRGNASANLDFNGNGTLQNLVSANLDCDNSSRGVFRASQNDWSVVVFNGAGTIGDNLLGAEKSQMAQPQMLKAYKSEDQVEPCMTEFGR
jgi:hypothetical protein